MYSIDINFLKDRGIVPGPELPTPTTVGPDLNKTPLYAGLGVGLLSLVAVGGWWFIINNQTADLQNQINALEGKKGQLAPTVKEIETLNAQTADMNTQTVALATAFDYIKPWSALLQDIRDRVPAGVQITLVEEKPPKLDAAKPPAPKPNPGAPPSATPAISSPPVIVEISGLARSFNDINDFLLMIQQSAFFQPKETKIITAELVSNKIKVQMVPNAGVELPPVVEYKIQTALVDVPSSDLLPDIRRKGAVGLESRIEKLKDIGVIKP